MKYVTSAPGVNEGVASVYEAIIECSPFHLPLRDGRQRITSSRKVRAVRGSVRVRVSVHKGCLSFVDRRGMAIQ